MIKMWFFTLWDNLFHVMVLSVGFLVPLGLFMLVAALSVPLGPLVFPVAICVGALFSFAYAGAVNRFTLDLVDGGSLQYRDFGRHFAAGLKTALAFGLLNFLLTLAVFAGMQFYGALNNILGIAATALMFWVFVFWLLLSQYWWPLNAQFEPKVGKLLRKCALLFFDNPAFTVFMFLGAVVITVLTILTASLFPGFAGLLLWFQVGLKLRMLKYDYLETLPEAQRQGKVKIPWDELLNRQRERIGTRSFKSLFLPWKD